MAIYNFFIFIVLFDKSYLFYVLFIISFGTVNLTIDGYAFEFLWPSWSWWANHSRMLFGSLAMFWALIFVRSFLEIKKNHPRLNIAFLLLILLAFIQSLFSLVYIPIAFKMIPIVFFPTGILILVSSVYSIRRKYKPAYFLFFGWSFLVIGTIIFLLSNLNILPNNVFTFYSMRLGSILDVVLLSLALAYRINLIKNQRNKALEENQQLLKDMNLKLEKLVEERTQKVRENEKRYKNLVDLLPEGVVVQSNGVIVYANENSFLILGAGAKEDIIGKNVIDLIHPLNKEVAIDRIHKIYKEKLQKSIMEYKVLRMDGTIVHLEMYSSYIEYNNQPAILTIARDISDQKKAQTIREETERLLRHEIKNYLNPIQSYSEIILMNYDNEKLTKQAKVINKQARKIRSCIDQYYDMFKMEEGNYILRENTFDLIKLLDDILSSFVSIIQTKELKFNIDIVENQERYFIVGDYIHLERLFMNLILNAIEASPDKEEIAIIICKENNFHKISIHNKGEIAQEIKDSFFDKYISYGKKNGIGLGTYIALLIAKTHKGRIRFSSSREEGTTLDVYLPEK